MRREAAGLAAARWHTAGVVGSTSMKVWAIAFSVATVEALESSLQLHCQSPFGRRYYRQLSSSVGFVFGGDLFNGMPASCSLFTLMHVISL